MQKRKLLLHRTIKHYPGRADVVENRHEIDASQGNIPDVKIIKHSDSSYINHLYDIASLGTTQNNLIFYSGDLLFICNSIHIAC